MNPVSVDFWAHILVGDIVFVGKTLYSSSASLQSGVLMVTGALLGQPDRMLRSNLCNRLCC